MSLQLVWYIILEIFIHFMQIQPISCIINDDSVLYETIFLLVKCHFEKFEINCS